MLLFLSIVNIKCQLTSSQICKIFNGSTWYFFFSLRSHYMMSLHLPWMMPRHWLAAVWRDLLSRKIFLVEIIWWGSIPLLDGYKAVSRDCRAVYGSRRQSNHCKIVTLENTERTYIYGRHPYRTKMAYTDSKLTVVFRIALLLLQATRVYALLLF